MITLAIESSTELGSLAIANQENGLLYSISWKRSRSHAETLTAEVESAVRFCNLEFEDIDFFSLGIGPGSFTGIRVGLNTVKTLAYATKKKTMVYDSLRIMAESLGLSKGKIVVIQNAFSNLLYFAKYEGTPRGLKVLTKPKLISASELEKNIPKGATVVGSTFFDLAKPMQTKIKKKANLGSFGSRFPDAAVLAMCALSDFSPKKAKTWEDLSPLYIRASAAEEKLANHELKPVL
ncbi:MAG: tRNA (adenosine(37)-N6)-threonylcarbamoyltransferase complex dimerization subunit type 1 TsaB [Bdellovibrionales bacterium]|nr:tRNA (adenosine(37)-N6)-threonylcarbamoyltransferase complex dimerization subunit type 1 TsaB [Bdellovibrionales bacterium]